MSATVIILPADFKRGYDAMREAMDQAPPISEAVSRFDASATAWKDVPALAALLEIEALADHRIWGDVCAASKLPMIRDMARRAIERTTGEKFSNPLFP
jgi:hypothetical protein